jgi:predicted nuclease of predicted toxin-antitoxin system
VKFIVDAQLPKALSEFLNESGFESIHTLDLPEKNQTVDSRIAAIANEENRIVISKDVDFLESFLIKSEPRKLIMVKTGNIVNRQLIKIFEDNIAIIIQMISRSNLIEITTTEIAEHK